jgi:HAD superfamily hydrolase (TIGR01549 family)
MMAEAVIFDVDGTLVDSVDLHAMAWHEAFVKFNHAVSFEEARSQIGKGGDKLLPVFLTDDQTRAYGDDIEGWRREHFRKHYLPKVRAFSAVPDLFDRLHDRGVRLAVASSSKREELDIYLEIAGVTQYLEAIISSEDADRSKPDPDVFAATLSRLKAPPARTIVVGDSPYDAQAAAGAGIRAVGVLSGCFPEKALVDAGCVAVYPGPAALWCCLEGSVLVD